MGLYVLHHYIFAAFSIIMGHKKLIRFAEMATFANVFQNDVQHYGQWHSYFGNTNPITLELACGKGEYTVCLAQLHPSSNYIGIDVKGNRIWVGAKKCIREAIHNAAFVRTQIDGIQNYFAPNEIAAIWITFPDPQLRWGKMTRRLTHPKYLRYYQKMLQPGGVIHLKTDSPDLYHFTKKVIDMHGLTVLEEYTDVHKQATHNPALMIRTYYEGLNISGSNTIYYLQFTIDNIQPGMDDALKQHFKPLVHE